MERFNSLQFDSLLSQMRHFQVRGQCERRQNPITGNWTASDLTRQFRPRARVLGGKLHTPACECDFCTGKTIPPVLVSEDGIVGMPDVTAVIARGMDWIGRNGPVTRENLSGLLDVIREDLSESRALVRAFPNAFPLPAIGNCDVENGFVLSAHPRYHDLDTAMCPREVLVGLVDLWKAIYGWCATKGFSLAAYINGGQDSRSGQTVAHPHGQALALNQTPVLYQTLQDAHRQGNCRVCQLKNMTDLLIPIPGSSSLLALADPAPQFSWSLSVVSQECRDDFLSEEFVTLFKTALNVLSKILGGVPAYNLAARFGTGHFNAEIIIRSSNITAGGEYAFREMFIDVPPSQVVKMLALKLGQEA
jgi:hypothetical protein